MNTSGKSTNDMLVLDIDTGVLGWNEFGLTVDVDTNDYSIAIASSSAFSNQSIINFPAGFEAFYAVVIDANFIGNSLCQKNSLTMYYKVLKLKLEYFKNAKINPIKNESSLIQIGVVLQLKVN